MAMREQAKCSHWSVFSVEKTGQRTAPCTSSLVVDLLSRRNCSMVSDEPPQKPHLTQCGSYRCCKKIHTARGLFTVPRACALLGNC